MFLVLRVCVCVAIALFHTALLVAGGDAIETRELQCHDQVHRRRGQSEAHHAGHVTHDAHH